MEDHNLFNDNIVKEFSVRKEESNGIFDWWDFISEKSDLPTSLGFAKFFCPDIIEVEGCFLLKNRYNARNFSEWKNEEGLNPTELEKITNLYEVTDFFPTNTDITNYSEMIDALGEILKYFWGLTLRDRYPNIKFVVDLFEEYEYEIDDKEYASLYITVYVDRLI